ncbi:MAG: energy transducer TonB [Steroidobacteraceae bacterium]
MAAYAHDPQYFTRRTVVLFIIIGLHVLLAWALVSGLAQKIVHVVTQPIETSLIEEIKADDEPPPPPPPEMERPPVEVPPPDIVINLPMESSTSTAITDVTDKPVPPRPPPPPPVAHEPVRVAPRLDTRRSPSTADYYPPSSRRNGEEGVTTVRACVDTGGKTTGTPTVVKSSGFDKLDEAAVKWASRARWSPGTADGKPTESCNSFNVRFKLTD